ncbi:hypothetical protein CsSME_00004688 [Camellia sinensis var. sinensis]
MRLELGVCPKGYPSFVEREVMAREKAMVVNLEFIKAIVTAEVLRFVDQLRQRLPHKSLSKSQGVGQMDVQDNEMQLSFGAQWLPVPKAVEGLQCDIPFEFQVLEITLKVVCTYLDSSVADLERDAYPVLDELVRNVSTKNLDYNKLLHGVGALATWEARDRQTVSVVVFF